MEYHLPEVYDASLQNLSHAKDAYLAHYAQLEQQRLLHCVLLEFKAQPRLQEVVFCTFDEGKSIDAELKFDAGFDPDADENYWDAKCIQNSLMAAYVPELAEFCRERTIRRSTILNDDNSPRFSNTRDMLKAVCQS